MSTYQVTWTNRKGAGMMRLFGDPDALAVFLERLRCEATIRNAQGVKVGGVEWAPDLFDDGRRRWAWWFDSTPALDRVEPPEYANYREL